MGNTLLQCFPLNLLLSVFEINQNMYVCGTEQSVHFRTACHVTGEEPLPWHTAAFRGRGISSIFFLPFVPTCMYHAALHLKAAGMKEKCA